MRRPVATKGVPVRSTRDVMAAFNDLLLADANPDANDLERLRPDVVECVARQTDPLAAALLTHMDVRLSAAQRPTNDPDAAAVQDLIDTTYVLVLAIENGTQHV
jgi:hypothetical protein